MPTLPVTEAHDVKRHELQSSTDLLQLPLTSRNVVALVGALAPVCFGLCCAAVAPFLCAPVAMAADESQLLARLGTRI